MIKKSFPFFLIFLLALALRVFQLAEIPPGLTHDEANHGREAIQILDGDLRYFFPLNYGSEPLYSYAVAGSMALLGEDLFALRVVNVLFGLAAIAAAYAWTREAFDRQTALLTAALLAISFWPLAASREALRAGMLPFFMILAVWFFWQILFSCSANSTLGQKNEDGPGTTASRWQLILLVIGFGLSIALTFHIYLAARVAWLLFPIFLGYLAVTQRTMFRASWRAVVGGLILAGLLVLPMFLYLANNPQSQTRLSMLGTTINSLQAGDLKPITQNAGEALLAFFWPGYGDQFVAYNIPGRPVFDTISAIFFIIGILVCLWRWKRPPYAFLLLWFLIGIIPSLVTGPTANTTRNLAALPAVFMLPAVGFVAAIRGLVWRFSLPEKPLLISGALLWLVITGFLSVGDYFVDWAEAPEVRSAYQHTLLSELAYRDQHGLKDTKILSTVYPGPVHDPSIALVMSGENASDLRWVDARFALILPDDSGITAIIPDSTPPHSAFAGLLQAEDRVDLRMDDLDPGFTLYAIENTFPEGATPGLYPANFGGAIQLESANWQQATIAPGEMAQLLTMWRVIDPAKVGPIHPPADATDTVFFTHILNGDETILAQRDALDAPSWSWQKGDRILQVHEILIPPETTPGTYQAVVGIYDPQTNQRLLILESNNPSGASTAPVPPLKVAQ